MPPAPGAVRRDGDRNWTRTGPLRLKSLRFAGLFRLESRLQGAIADSLAAQTANPDFRMEFAGLPWDFERQKGLGRPHKPVRLFTT